MQTDAQFYQIFRRFPELVFLLAGLPSPGACSMKSVAIKAISRTMDGFIEPLDPNAALQIAEFQMQHDKFVFHRTVIEQTSVQMEHYPREVHSLIIFGSRYLDPRTEPWQNVVKVIYLDEAMQTLAETQSNHFLISLFRPLVEPEKSVVEKLAQEDYHRLKAVHVEDSQPAGLEAIFLDWLMQLFKTKTRSEIAKMIAELTPIEETVAGRELIAIGEERGMERGMEQLILQQISERFGRVSLETQKGIAALPVKHLPELGRALLRFPDVAALESWLRLRLGN